MACVIRTTDTVWRDVLAVDGNFDVRTHRFETHAVPLFWDTLRLQRKQQWSRPTLFTWLAVGC